MRARVLLGCLLLAACGGAARSYTARDVKAAYFRPADFWPAMVGGFRMMRKIVDAAPMDSYRGEEFSPGPSVQTDEQILTWIRNNSQTAYHPIGTCRMGPAGPTTVVDDKLKVHGLEGLRVADASIFPTMPSGNTNAPSIMVGEKMADILKAA